MSQCDLAAFYRRPVIGFVVEGHGEYASFPPLTARIAVAQNPHIKIARPLGYGRILKDLEGVLDDLVITWHPITVIITIDLDDVVKDGFAADCAELRQSLARRVDEWFETRKLWPRLSPLPVLITCVIQIRKLETWIISDPEGLATHGCFDADIAQQTWINVDDEVENPAKWIKQHVVQPFDSKNPVQVKEAFAVSDIARMAKQSRSFGKFVRTVQEAFRKYDEQALLQMNPPVHDP